MKINRIHAIVGFLLIIVPLLGLGHTFKNGFSIFTGTVILFFAVQSIQLEYRKKHRRPHRHDAFVEGRPSESKSGDKHVDISAVSDSSDFPPTE